MGCQRPILVILTLLTLVPGCIFCLSGCKEQDNQRELMLSDFDFLEHDTTFREIVSRVGWPDHSIGSGFITYQYDISDGCVIELSFFGGQLYARVQEETGIWTDLDLSEKAKGTTVWHIVKWLILVLAVLGVGYWTWKRLRATPNKTLQAQQD